MDDLLESYMGIRDSELGNEPHYLCHSQSCELFCVLTAADFGTDVAVSPAVRSAASGQGSAGIRVFECWDEKDLRRVLVGNCLHNSSAHTGPQLV